MNQLFVEQPISLDQLDAVLQEAEKLTSAADRRAFRANFFIPVMLEWFHEEGGLRQWPVLMMEWMDNFAKKYPILKKRAIVFNSMYVVKAVSEGPRPSVTHVARRIVAGIKMDEPYVKAMGENRVVTMTPREVIVKGPDDQTELERWKYCIKPDGTYEWVQFFHRQPKYIDDTMPHCPPTVQEARNRAHGMIGRLTGFRTVDEYFPKYFGDLVSNQDIAYAPARVEQAQMIVDIVEFFKAPHGDEEINDFVQQIKDREIACGVSRLAKHNLLTETAAIN